MEMEKQTMQFLYGDRELLLQVCDLFAAPVDVIVSPANSQLSHDDGLAGQVLLQAGPQLRADCAQLIREYGEIDTGMAVFSGAGELPFKAIIHAVAPVLGEGDEQRKLEQAVSRSLQLCELNDWSSIALPAIGTGNANLPLATSAQACFRAISRFWDARHECVLERVVVCLRPHNFQDFFAAFREQGLEDEAEALTDAGGNAAGGVGVVELNEEDIAGLVDDEIDDWFT